ncbi:MAG: hypothetical protein JXR34_02645 [Bacteroidales bacterium]|nr:hypothetical protein [Bacteroidales bacterium]
MIFMLIIGDGRLPAEIRQELQGMGEFFGLSSSGVVYPAISGHPDIFLHKTADKLIVAPNSAKELIDKFIEKQIPFVFGEKELGISYPETAFYNATYAEEVLFCNQKLVDVSILEAHAGKKIQHFNQGYVSCNLVVGGESLLTSDRGIEKSVRAYFFPPTEIRLEGVKHGFIGGACSIWQESLLINGSLKKTRHADILLRFAEENHLIIKELYDGSLIDGGGLIFLP